MRRLPQRLYDIAKRVGVRLVYVENWDLDRINQKPMYRASNHTSYVAGPDQYGISNGAHEVGHWVVATDQDKGWDDYGELGPECRAIDLPPEAKCAHDEEWASLLGIFLEKRLFGKDQAKFTFDYHSWYDFQQALAVARQLIKAGHLVRARDGKLWPKGTYRE